MTTDKEQLLRELKRIRDKGPEFPQMGICNNTTCDPELLQEAFEAWDEFDGDTNYPIKHHIFDPLTAYAKAKLRCTLWDRHTEYGSARWRLLDHCISYLEGVKE